MNAVEAIADYGHYALEFLAESKGWVLDGGMYNGMFREIAAANDFTADDLQAVREAVAGEQLMKNVMTIDDNETKIFDYFGVRDVDISLNLDYETQLYFYITVEDSFSVNHDWETTQTSNVYLCKSPGIPAHRMNEDQYAAIFFPLACCSPLGYVNAVLNSDAPAFSTNACKNAMAAIYRYYYHARQYQYQMMSAALDGYNLEGAKAWTGTENATGCEAVILYYTSSTYTSNSHPSGEYMIVDGLQELGGPIVAYDEETQTYTQVSGINDNPQYIRLADDYTLTQADSREALFSLLIKGIYVPK